jgi:hypothetical protein
MHRLDRLVPAPIVGDPVISEPILAFRYFPLGSTVSSKTSCGVPPTALSKDEKPEEL